MAEVSGVPAPSLDGRRFRSAGDVPGGDVGAETVFEYAEAGGIVHARSAAAQRARAARAHTTAASMRR